jgi:hypothetical protein
MASARGQPPAVHGQGALEARVDAAFQALAGAGERPARRSLSPTRHQPWSREQYLDRLASFKLSTWYGKGPSWSAPACAARGWRNAGKDSLDCSLCRARTSVEGAGEEQAAALAQAHGELCPWRGSGCPPSMVLPRPEGGHAGVVALTAAAAAIAGAVAAALPAAAPSHVRLQPSVLPALLSSARAAVRDSRCSPQVEGALLGCAPTLLSAPTATATTDLTTTAVALVLCGWGLVEDGEEGGRSRGAKRSRQGEGGEGSGAPASLRCASCGATTSAAQLAAAGVASGVDPLAGHRWHCASTRPAYPLQRVLAQRAADAVKGGVRPPWLSAWTPATQGSSAPPQARPVGGVEVAAGLAAMSAATLGVADMRLVAALLRGSERTADGGRAGEGQLRTLLGEGDEEGGAGDGEDDVLPGWLMRSLTLVVALQ